MWPFKKKSTTSGRRDNRWTGGDVQLILPPLPPEDVGVYGARFYTNEFQKHSGTETWLCIFEEPEWARRYGNIKRIDLYVTNMVVRADGGLVAIALWNLLDAGKSLCHYEHYLDPLSEPTLQSLRKMEQQSRLKLVMRDNQSGETTGFWEFDNNFQMSDFASSLAAACEGHEAGSFDDRVAEIKRDYTTEQLIAMSESSLDEDEATDAGFAVGRTTVVDVEKVTRGEVSGSGLLISNEMADAIARRMFGAIKLKTKQFVAMIKLLRAEFESKILTDLKPACVAMWNSVRDKYGLDEATDAGFDAAMSDADDEDVEQAVEAAKNAQPAVSAPPDADREPAIAETTPAESQDDDKTFSTKHAYSAAAREELDMPERPKVEKQSREPSIEAAAAYGKTKAGSDLIDTLVAELTNAPRSVTEWENDLLNFRNARLSNKLDKATKKPTAAKEENAERKATKTPPEATEEYTEASLLIDSVVQNSLETLGYNPDGASLAFLASHPFLAGRIWRMLGDGGAANTVGRPVSKESEESCELLVHYVRDESFRNRFPCTGALMQYAVYLCDQSPEERFGCCHPKDECVTASTLGHAPTPSLVPKTQPTQSPKPEPVPLQSSNPKSSQTVTSSLTSIVIPNSHNRDLDGVFAHLNQFGRWGMDKRKRFIIANWSWHTVVRIYAKGETIDVSASPRFRTMIVFGFIPMCFIASALKGHGGLAALEVASGFGLGWLFWWMFLLSDTLERMQKILVAPTPPTDPNMEVARGETPAADSTQDQSESIVQIRLVEDELRDEESQHLGIAVQLTAERSKSSIGGDGADRVQVNTRSLDVPTIDATNAHSERPQHDRVPAWSYVIGGVLLFGFGLAIGLAFGTRSGSVNLREEYDRRLKAHLARYEDDPMSITLATFGFYFDERLSPFDQKESADQIDFVDVAKTLQESPDAPKDDPPSSNNHATRNDVREIAPHGTLQPSDDKPLVDGFSSLSRSKMDQFEKDSILQLRPDRATEVMAFVEYEQGVESARRADQLNVENTDQLWESASESLNKAVALDPSFVAPRIVLACIHLYYKNEHDKAKQLLDEAIRREPANAEAHYYLADVHYDDGNEEEAMREVNLAINLDPNLAPAYRMRSRLYEARNELSEAANDFIESVSLTGNLDADHVYPWTLRSVLFRSKESGLTLQYSSVWYPFESMAKGSELRLIRHDHSREIAFSLIYLGEVFHPGMKREDMVVDLFEGMCEAFVGNAEIVRIGAGDLILGRQWVHWIDYEIESPPLLATRSRIFMLEHAGKVWSIQFSTRDEVLFRQYLPSAEEVIRSISFH